MRAYELALIHSRQREGIEAAKARGVKMGRPPKPLPDNFYEVYQEWVMGKTSAIAAAKKCGMPETTFLYKAIAYRQSTQKDDTLMRKQPDYRCLPVVRLIFFC